MKNYICLNHGECHWADEVPPREFPLVDGEVNCPNCNSANIREVAPEQNKLKRFLPLVAGVILVLGLIWFFWPKSTTGGDVTKQDKSDGKIPKDTSRRVEEPGIDTTQGGETDKKDKRIPNSPPNDKSSPKVTYRKVAGSEFCVGDCVVEYTEQDNLGHTRVRRINNYDKCCPADK